MQYKNIVRIASVIFAAIVMPAIAKAQVDDGDGMGAGSPIISSAKVETGGTIIRGPNKSDPGYAAAQAKRMAEMDQARLLSLKNSLGSNDAEWSVIEPKIRLIQALQSASGTGGVMLLSIAKNPDANPLMPKCVFEVRLAQQALQKVIDGRAAAEDVRAKLVQVRQTRTEVRNQLAKSRQELIALLTVQQEAILFQRGLLD